MLGINGAKGDDLATGTKERQPALASPLSLGF